MEYLVATGYTTKGLIENVEHGIRSGYVPLGGVSAVKLDEKQLGNVPEPNYDGILYIQAMIKEN